MAGPLKSTRIGTHATLPHECLFADESHRIVPILGLTLFGFGLLGIFLPTQQYLVDAFQTYSASAVAAVRTSLSIVGAFLPLAGPPLYSSLNYGLGNTVLAIIALAMTPIPMLFYK